LPKKNLISQAVYQIGLVILLKKRNPQFVVKLVIHDLHDMAIHSLSATKHMSFIESLKIAYFSYLCPEINKFLNNFY
jgi:hypothetical protein